MEVVRLGALADYVTEDEYRAELGSSALSGADVSEALEDFRRSVSIRVEQFAILFDGRRLVLDDERGFSSRASGVRGAPDSVDPWSLETVKSIEHGVRNCVLPDDGETDDEHPWPWLADRLGALGVAVSPDELRHVPYDVVFSDRLGARLSF